MREKKSVALSICSTTIVDITAPLTAYCSSGTLLHLPPHDAAYTCASLHCPSNHVMTQPHHDPEAATMDHHTHHSGSYDEPQHPSSSSSSATATSGREADAGFFERERNRLIQDISKVSTL